MLEHVSSVLGTCKRWPHFQPELTEQAAKFGRGGEEMRWSTPVTAPGICQSFPRTQHGWPMLNVGASAPNLNQPRSVGKQLGEGSKNGLEEQVEELLIKIMVKIKESNIREHLRQEQEQ